MKKTIGELIDGLSIVNIKIHFLANVINRGKQSREDSKKLQGLNKLRKGYIKAICAEFKIVAKQRAKV